MWIAAWADDHEEPPDEGMTEVRKWFGRCDFVAGWKVAWKGPDGTVWYIPLNFARQKDAQAAADELRKHLDGSTLKQIQEQARTIGGRQIRKLILESLAW